MTETDRVAGGARGCAVDWKSDSVERKSKEMICSMLFLDNGFKNTIV
jgi:hypothetical protein